MAPIRPSKELLERWRREDEEAREIRRKMADWDFINSLPVRLREALKCFIECGDRYVAASLAGLTLEEFDELRLKAKIPVVV